MKILFVIDTFYTSNNGTSTSAQHFVAGLRRLGHEVRLLCGDKPRTEADKSLTDGDFCIGIFHFPIFQFLCEKHDFFYGKWDKKVIKEACDWADVVHLYTPLFMSNATLKYCKQVGKPVTAAYHIQPENITSSFGVGKVKWINDMIYKIFRHFTYSHVRHIHTPSFFIANELRKHDYFAHMHIISNGINEEFLDAGKKKINGERTGNNKTKGLFKIMMIGRLSQEKRQDVIIKAMKYSKYADRIQLVFAGKGPEYKHYLELGKGLKNKPQFIFCHRDELIQELLSTDLYVHASDMEIEAISCIEAFATGLVPVIANSPASATPQFALDKRCLFLPGDPKDLARAIDYWLDHPQERKQMEEKYVRNAYKYTIGHCTVLFEQMLKQEIIDNSNITNNDSYETTQDTSHVTVLGAIKRQVIRLYRRIA
ncbi:MAG: glycosyltransferase [Paludibacteraceae bacterium]|nr:glycosyltransferase [Paludibacteraceae bacterium]